MVMLNVPVTVAPVASCTVIEVLANVPAVVGVPVKTTLVPATVALRPGGRLDWATTVNDPVPPLIGMVPVKPGWLTVHWVGASAPSAGAALTVKVKPALATAPVASLTAAPRLKVPAAVGVPL